MAEWSSLLLEPVEYPNRSTWPDVCISHNFGDNKLTIVYISSNSGKNNWILLTFIFIQCHFKKGRTRLSVSSQDWEPWNDCATVVRWKLDICCDPRSSSFQRQKSITGLNTQTPGNRLQKYSNWTHSCCVCCHWCRAWCAPWTPNCSQMPTDNIYLRSERFSSTRTR